MKVLIAVHHFPPHHIGGAELRACRTAAALRDRGHDVYVVCVESIDADNGRGIAFEDGSYNGLSVRRLSFDLRSAPDPFRWSYDNPWIGHHLREYLKETEAELFHLFGGYLMSGSAIAAAKSQGVPAVVTLTDFWFLCPRITMLRSNGRTCSLPLDVAMCARCLGEAKRLYHILGRIAPRLMRAFWEKRLGRIAQIRARMDFLQRMLGHVDVIISPSQFLRDIFVEAGTAPEQIVFSRQGQSFPHLTSEILKKPPASHLRLGYVGQIAPHKGVHILFEAAQQLPRASLRVKAYGNVESFPNYTQQLRHIARRDSRLDLAGVYERTELSQVFQELDAVVVPSVWHENSPNAILEAFGHRTPVIASDLGGMAELVDHEKNGLLFSPGDAGNLAEQIQRLTKTPDLLPTLRAGIGPVKSLAQEIDELEAIYQSVVNKKKLQSREFSSKSSPSSAIAINWSVE
jgi:glycosyltransferase involved in cell wall biosynthesis